MNDSGRYRLCTARCHRGFGYLTLHNGGTHTGGGAGCMSNEAFALMMMRVINFISRNPYLLVMNSQISLCMNMTNELIYTHFARVLVAVKISRIGT